MAELDQALSERLLDPQLRPALAVIPTIAISRENLADIRSAMGEFFKTAATPPSSLIVEELTVEREHLPPFRIVRYRPDMLAEPTPAVLHVHGGGFILGVPEMADASSRQIAADFECQIFSVDYRLAPDVPYPGALDDCFDALRHLHDHAKDLFIDPAHIGVKGESAGGGLAAALALRARDTGDLPLAFQHLTYPMLDDRTVTSGDVAAFVGQFAWTRDNNAFGWSSLIAAEPGGPNVPVYAAPARAEDLSGLPPTFIAVGGLDLFLQEDLDYAHRLMRGGVAVELHVYPGAFHGFDLVADAHVSQALLRDSRAALGRFLRGGA